MGEAGGGKVGQGPGRRAWTSAARRVAFAFERGARTDYIGEPVSIAQHSLQSAGLAAREGDGDEETVLAARGD